MLTLAGQGDIEVKLVDKETWDWINKPNDPCPPAVLERIREEQDDPECVPNITIGSPDNDAALWSPAVKIDGIEASFDSVSDAIRFIRKHDIEIEDDYEGCIY
jgi:hypothetical protein